MMTRQKTCCNFDTFYLKTKHKNSEFSDISNYFIEVMNHLYTKYSNEMPSFAHKSTN